MLRPPLNISYPYQDSEQVRFTGSDERKEEEVTPVVGQDSEVQPKSKPKPKRASMRQEEVTTVVGQDSEVQPKSKPKPKRASIREEEEVTTVVGQDSEVQPKSKPKPKRASMRQEEVTTVVGQDSEVQPKSKPKPKRASMRKENNEIVASPGESHSKHKHKSKLTADREGMDEIKSHHLKGFRAVITDEADWLTLLRSEYLAREVTNGKVSFYFDEQGVRNVFLRFNEVEKHTKYVEEIVYHQVRGIFTKTGAKMESQMDKIQCTTINLREWQLKNMPNGGNEMIHNGGNEMIHNGGSGSEIMPNGGNGSEIMLNGGNEMIHNGGNEIMLNGGNEMIHNGGSGSEIMLNGGNEMIHNGGSEIMPNGGSGSEIIPNGGSRSEMMSMSMPMSNDDNNIMAQNSNNMMVDIDEEWDFGQHPKLHVHYQLAEKGLIRRLRKEGKSKKEIDLKVQKFWQDALTGGNECEKSHEKKRKYSFNNSETPQLKKPKLDLIVQYLTSVGKKLAHGVQNALKISK